MFHGCLSVIALGVSEIFSTLYPIGRTVNCRAASVREIERRVGLSKEGRIRQKAFRREQRPLPGTLARLPVMDYGVLDRQE
jgi:hypothetical protein